MNGISTIRKFSRGYRHAGRYREILGILVKNGFGYLFENRRRIFSRGADAPLLNDDPGGRRLVRTLTELGPTFIKFGQMLSCRPDLLPEELIRALVKLQTDVPPFPREEAVRMLEKELGKPLDELFSVFPEDPSGSASVAQGYRAVLKDGREVFVKVQRPGILPRIMVDLEILGVLAEHLERSFPELAEIRPVKLAEDFRDGFLRELDFLNEAANMRAFARQFGDDDAVVIPEPIPGYCTRHILTMTYISALPFTDMEAIRKSGIDCGKIAELGVRLLQKQVFDAGFFHGDPHPGNMFVLPGPKIAYVDFGVMGRLTGRERGLLRKIAAAMFFDDMREMAYHVAALSENPEEVNVDALERELATLVSSHLHGSVNDLNVVQFVFDLNQLCYRRKLRMAPHLFRMFRAMGYADAMGRALVPDFNIMALLRPYVLKQSIAELNPLHRWKELLRGAGEWTELLRHAPHLTRQIMERLKDGRLTVRMDQPDTRKLAESVKLGARRVADALLISALLVVATLFIAFKVGPLCCGVSGFGGAAMAVALLMLAAYFFRKD